MALMPLVTRAWASQPQSVAGLSSQAKADGCAFAMGANGYNAATQRLPVFVGTGVSFVNSRYGVAARGTPNSQGIGYAAKPGFSELVPLANSFTVLALVRINTQGARRFIAGDYTAGGSAAQYTMYQTTGNQLQVGTGTSFSIAGGALTTGWHWLEHTYDIANNSNVIYVDGVMGDANNGPARPTGASGQFRILSGGEYTSESFDGDIASFLIFKSVLTRPQRELYKSNPNLVFAPSPRIIYTSVAAGGGGVAASVTATEGADVLTASASVIASASSATTDGVDVLAANVNPQAATTSATSATTDGTDVLASSISVIATASSATTDGADALAATVSSSGTAISSGTTDGADVLAAAVGPQVAAASAATDGMDVLAASAGPIVGIASGTVDGSDTLLSNVAPVQLVAVSAAIADGADVWAANVFTSALGGGGGPSSEPRKKKRFLVNHDGQTLAFDTRRAAERAVYQLGAKAVLVAQPVADSATRLAAQRAIDDALEEEDELEMLLLAL